MKYYRWQRQRYTSEKRLSVINKEILLYARTHSVRETAAAYGVASSTVSRLRHSRAGKRLARQWDSIEEAESLRRTLLEDIDP